MQKPYPVSDQNGQTGYPIYDQNGSKTLSFGTAHTHIAHIRNYPLPRELDQLDLLKSLCFESCNTLFFSSTADFVLRDSLLQKAFYEGHWFELLKVQNRAVSQDASSKGLSRQYRDVPQKRFCLYGLTI